MVITGRLTDLIRQAAAGELEDGWLQLPAREFSAATECLFLPYDDFDNESEYDPDEMQAAATALGYPVEGLDTATLSQVFEYAQELADPVTDVLLTRAFGYYLEFDAFLPGIDAPDPPPQDVWQAALDREFYDFLGPEISGTVCDSPGCARGAIANGVFCRSHHFEMIFQRTCPFQD